MEDSRTEHIHRRKFALGFLLSFGLFIVLIGLFNWLIDPYQFSKNRFAGINDAFSSENFHGEGALEKAFNFSSKGNAARVSMIGTSHLKRGFSIAQRPDFEVFALSDLKIQEAIDILQIIIDQSKVSKTILIEIGRNTKPHRGDEITWQKRYFSANTTLRSMRMISRSIELRDSDYKYKIRKIVPKPMPGLQYFERQRKELVKDFTSDEIPLDSLFSRIVAKNSGLQHKVVFFTSPLPFGFLEGLELQEVVKSRQGKIRESVLALNRDGRSIKFYFLGFWDTSLFNDYLPWTDSFHDGWYDDDHYKPAIGDQLLEHLLQLSETPISD